MEDNSSPPPADYQGSSSKGNNSSTPTDSKGTSHQDKGSGSEDPTHRHETPNKGTPPQLLVPLSLTQGQADLNTSEDNRSGSVNSTAMKDTQKNDNGSSTPTGSKGISNQALLTPVHEAADTSSNIVVAGTCGPDASNVVANLEQTVESILEIGGGSWERDAVIRALNDTHNNPERAVEILSSVQNLNELRNFMNESVVTVPVPPTCHQAVAATRNVTDAVTDGASSSNGGMGANIEQIVQYILEIGDGAWKRDTVLLAMHAAKNDVGTALDFLSTERNGRLVLKNHSFPTMRPDRPKPVVAKDHKFKGKVKGLSVPVDATDAVVPKIGFSLEEELEIVNEKMKNIASSDQRTPKKLRKVDRGRAYLEHTLVNRRLFEQQQQQQQAQEDDQQQQQAHEDDQQQQQAQEDEQQQVMQEEEDEQQQPPQE